MEFPQELVDYVIDFLHDSPSSLKACSLTCRAWAESSQHHLFDSIRLRNPGCCEELISMIDDRPGLVYCITELSLPFYLDHQFDGLIDLMSRLPNVKRLHPGALVQLFDDTLTEKFIASIAPISSILTHLDTAYMVFETAEEFVKLISCMPSLEKLSFGAKTNKRSRPSPTASPPPPIPQKLTELSVSYKSAHSHPPLHWFRSLAPQIVSLDLEVYGSISYMSEVCKLFGPRITRLDIHSDDGDMIATILEGGFPKLQYLVLHTWLTVDWFSSVISEIHSEQLRKITIEIIFPSKAESLMMRYDWSKFDAITDQRFPHLTEIRFLLKLAGWTKRHPPPSFDPPTMSLQRLKSLMPLSVKKGILVFDIPSRSDLVLHCQVKGADITL